MMDEISPVSFIKPSVEIEAKFLNDEGDKYIWYRGVVTKVHKVHSSPTGRYIDCDVLYDDGEEVKNSIFHDVDFEEDNDDSWRFAEAWSKLIKIVEQKNKEIEWLREEIEDLLDPDFDIDDEDSESEDDDEDSESEDSGSEDDTAYSPSEDIIIKYNPEPKKHCWKSFFLGFSIGAICTLTGVIVDVIIKSKI